MDEEKKPVSRYVLKPRQIEPTEAPSVLGDGTAISTALMHKENALAEAKARGRPDGAGTPAHLMPQALADPPPGFKVREIDPLDPPSAEGDESAIRIETMLRQNRISAALKGPELIAMPERRFSRRKRDFFVILVLAAATAGVLTLIFRHDGQLISLALAAIAFITLALTWVLFGVMDNY